MADNPNLTAGATSEDGSLSQADIDAAMAAGAGGEPAPAQTEDGTAPSEPSGQGEIDAMVAGAQDEPLQDVGELNQDDIDSLLGISDGEGGSQAESAPEPDARLDSMGRPFDDAATAMAAAIAEEQATGPVGPTGQPLDLPDFAGEGEENLNHGIDLLNDVGLRVKIELGRTRMYVEDVLKLAEGSVVELDKLAGDPVDVFANERLIARGEVLVLNDTFCVRVSEIMSGVAASAMKS